MAATTGLRRGLATCPRADSSTRSLVTALTPAPEQFISPEEFNRQYLQRARPGYFPRLVSHRSSPFRWPACSEWPGQGEGRDAPNGVMGGLRKIRTLQNALVDVEISPLGRGYGDGVQKDKENSDWMKVAMPFEVFLDAFIDGKIPWKSREGQDRVVGYLAQQNLFENSEELTRQCPPLPHTVAGSRGAQEQWRRNVWIGGSGSFTPIHCDPYENVFVQVVGSKRAHLFPPSVAKYLRLFPASTSQSNTSSIPVEDVLLAGSRSLSSKDGEYADVEEALFHPESRHVSLEAGDALYIPRGWFHCLRSTSISASVNAWFR
ncbi:hypothetical protein CBS101457_006441 [Exobasidium rhododendri]|nr:hypothetical protein CBS101457_006441 [Exobasidium rhododendri]